MTEHLKIAQSLIEKHEGLRLFVYDDATGAPVVPGYTLKGHPTIGFGRALDVKGISRDEAGALLRCDLIDALHHAQDFAGPAWDRLSPARKAALIDMAHNLGWEGLSAFRRFQAALQAGLFSAASAEMLNSRWAGQVGRRAKRLSDIMERGTA